MIPNLQKKLQNNLANCMMASCEHIGQAMDKIITGVAEVCGEIAEATARASHTADEALTQVKDMQLRQWGYDQEAQRMREDHDREVG